MKLLSVLIGPPSIGKSDWTKKYARGSVVISRDEIIERVSSAYDLTYDETYVAPPKDAEVGSTIEGMEKFGRVVTSDLEWREFDFEVPQKVHREANELLLGVCVEAAHGQRDVVIDMTNMDKKNRALYMRHFGDDFYKVAVVFNFSSTELVDAIKRRAKERGDELAKQGRPKTISPEVIDRMITSYEAPSKSEGFDAINTYDNSHYLLNLPRDPLQEQNRSGILEAIRNVLKTITGHSHQ